MLSALILLALLLSSIDSSIRSGALADQQPNHFQMHHHHLNKSIIESLEVLAESYYYEHLEDRAITNMNPLFNNINANFPCIFGTFPVGGSDHESVMDGHKYLCGLLSIKTAPIIYSYGSHRDDKFERALLELRPDAKIFVFDLLPDQLPLNQHPLITYSAIGLGGYDGNSVTKEGYKLRSMADSMKLFNHTYVDILKIDIEGNEYAWEKHEREKLGHRVGQLLIEIHANSENKWALRFESAYDTREFVKKLELSGMRIFHREINHMSPWCCIELSLVQKKWVHFEDNKLKFLPIE